MSKIGLLFGMRAGTTQDIADYSQLKLIDDSGMDLDDERIQAWSTQLKQAFGV